MVDNKKVNTDAPAFELVGVDFFELPTHAERYHIARHPDTLVKKMSARNKVPFMFIINLLIPGPPHVSMVIYFMPNEQSPVRTDGSAFSKLMTEFLDGTDEQRKDRFKVIPRIVEGSWIVKQAVKNKPTILGHKIYQPYFTGPNYMEVDVDITSSATACAVLGICIPSAKTLVVDILFLLEGKSSEELPEKVIGAICFKHLELKGTARKIRSNGSVPLK
jgi:hypothetical protein